ncbi:MAB_1171c family putative transporter [Salinispora oceanensis]|uniref:MAB_1171c family putative transporter n=1 Tax=Salinispora oceanensis TaxID=1050199 RepID=UPI0003746AB2|nr:MAB_1171c family putative transporter [Salinispora oceanensis]
MTAVEQATEQFNILYPVCAVAAFATAAYRLWRLRQDPENVALAGLAGYLACFVLAFTFATPVVYSKVGALTGMTNLATLVVYVAVIGTALAQTAVQAWWLYPRNRAVPAIRRRLTYFIATLVAMAVLFALAPVDDAEHPVDFDAHYAATPLAAAFLLIYLAAFSAMQLDLAITSRRCARAVKDQTWLRRGLHTVAAGGLVSQGYAAIKAGTLIGLWAGPDETLARWNIQAAPIVASLAALLITGGWIMPAWARQLDGLSAWLRLLRTYQRLYPLWVDLCRSTDNEYALDKPTSRLVDTARAARDVKMRTYRLIIEIRDAQLALRPYLDAAEVDRARRSGARAGLAGVELEAVVEAAALAASIAGKQGGHSTDEESMTGHTEVGGDLASEVDWLTQVARAYRDSPIVAVAKLPPSVRELA